MALQFPHFDTRVAAYAVIFDGDGRLLLSWFNAPGGGTQCWTLPGGGVDHGEQLADAMVREVYEETGYLVEVGPILTTHVQPWQGLRTAQRPGQSVRILYLAHVIGGQLGTLEVGGSTDRAEWIDLSSLADDVPVAGLVDVAIAALTHLSEKSSE